MLEPSRNEPPERRAQGNPGRLVFGNRLLDALDADSGTRLAPALRRIFLERDQTMVRPDERLQYLHFPVDAFAWSWTESTGTERPTSVLTVGHRGVLEWNRVLQADVGQTCVKVISPGAAWRLPLETFDEIQPEPDSPLRRILLRYANAIVLNAACKLACNSEHNIDQRLARWLLWVADESARSEFSITHQQIAEIAAIRRPSVSLGLSQFQRDGVIRSHHGHLRIEQRDRLEEAVCRCYWVIRENIESIFAR